MWAATATISILLAAALSFSAVRKLSHDSQVVEAYARAGVPEDKLDYLAVVLLAGAAGLVLGLLWAPIGIAATIGLVCYFLVAVAFHVRANDTQNLPTPLVIALLAAALLVLRLATP